MWGEEEEEEVYYLLLVRRKIMGDEKQRVETKANLDNMIKMLEALKPAVDNYEDHQVLLFDTAIVSLHAQLVINISVVKLNAISIF